MNAGDASMCFVIDGPFCDNWDQVDGSVLFYVVCAVWRQDPPCCLALALLFVSISLSSYALCTAAVCAFVAV